jgi:hypothetical protein
MVTSTPLSFNQLKVEIAKRLRIDVDDAVFSDHKKAIKDSYVLAHAKVSKGLLQRGAAAVSAQASEAPAVADAETAQKTKRSKIRTFTPKHKYNILTEALHGNHTKPDGKRIDFQDRNKHGNLGPFYASICNVLNDKVSYPAFSTSKAVETTVRQWLDTAIQERIDWLTQTFSANFIEHRDFMKDYGHPIESSDSEDNVVLKYDRISDDRYDRMNKELLDSLIHLDKIHETDRRSQSSISLTEIHTSSQEEDFTAGKVDGLTHGVAAVIITEGDGDENSKKKRKHKLDRPRDKKINPAVQLQEQQNSISSLLDKLMAFSGDPTATSSSAPADPAIRSIHQALVQHPTPPGTVSVCEKLAENLAGYGFCTFQELMDFPRARAREILAELKWSPLQIEKVLGSA